MHVQIVVQSPKTTWTNLDHIQGRVILRLFAPTPLSSIVVKLEGESRTRLRAAPRSGPGRSDARWDDWHGEKAIMREETHKLLYRVANVFPDASLAAQVPPGRSVSITLPPGDYEYPFEFKFPFNNSCTPGAGSVLAGIALIKNVGLKGAASPVTHVRSTLPPTLTTFPGVAEIRYYVKATVNRKEFYKENPRVVQNLNFLPIEPPRQPATGAESYARRQHEFVAIYGAGGKQKAGFLGALKGSSRSAPPPSLPTNLPVISIDLRLPNPAILTCHEDLPLRIILQKLRPNNELLYLQSLHIQLHGTTRIRANEIWREESSNWVLVSKSNMGFPLQPSQIKESQDGEITIDPGYWRRCPLPKTVAPTFKTCNISRWYEIEVSLGIGYHSAQANNTVIIPLRHGVQVYSGFKPPETLLAAMASGKVPNRKPIPVVRPEKSSSVNAPTYMRNDTPGSSSMPHFAIPPTAQVGPSTPFEPQQTEYGPLPPGEEEPPPTYEDAIAQDLPPIDGPRRDYEPPAAGPQGFGVEKGRRDS